MENVSKASPAFLYAILAVPPAGALVIPLLRRIKWGESEARMNPLTWKREHQLAWAVVIAAGGVAGLIFGWLVSPYSRVAGGDTALMFLAWIHNPVAYW